MITRAEFLYAKSKMERLDNAIFEFEAGKTTDLEGVQVDSTTYQLWQKHLEMDPVSRHRLETEWKEYYAACRQSSWGEFYAQAAAALKRKDLVTVRRLANEAKHSTILKLIPEPATPDPEIIKQKLLPYFHAVTLLDRLRRLVTEYEPVYNRSAQKKEDKKPEEKGPIPF